MFRPFAWGAVVLALLSAGCGLFKPRDPVRVGGGSSCSICLARSTANNVEANVQQTYGSDSCLSCYTDGLDASFAFHPDPTDIIQSDSTIFANWNYNVESRVAANIAADTVFVTAVFDSEYAPRSIVDQPLPRRETRYYAYHVWVYTQSDSVRYQGLADVTYQESSDALWRITTWVDKRDGSGLQTWGLLRRDYRVGF
jgi:hypothetical protein